MPLTTVQDRFVVFAANFPLWNAQAYRASHAVRLTTNKTPCCSMLCMNLPAHICQLYTTVCTSVECAFQVVVPLLLCCLSFACVALHELQNRIVCASPSWHFHGPPWQLLQLFDQHHHPDHSGSCCHLPAQCLAIAAGCNISACVQASASSGASHLCLASRPSWQLSRGF